MEESEGPRGGVEAVIFDMDGVILDTETLSNRVWIQAAEELGLSDIRPAMFACIGMNKADTVLLLRRFYGDSFDAPGFLERTSELFREAAARDGIPLMPHALEAVRYVRGRHRLALASSTREAVVRRQLSAAGLLDCFETLTCGDMVEHSKPDPEIYLRACASLGVEPARCAAIEDSPNGVRSAAAAGLKVVMVPDKIQAEPEIKALLWHLCPSLDGIKSFL
ncbi:MAG: HAD family phosphatase [Treponemataceae bacterium]|nr:HAD family phosphatase [Treponemataceae bacterium]